MTEAELEAQAAQEAAIDAELDKLEKVVSHIEHVRNNCVKLGRLMIKDGEIEDGRRLVALGHIHDNSKFSGVEWLYLGDDKAKSKLEMAVSNHNTTNPHHPEYWGGIENMPRLFIAEMVCDWAARASEFATSLREWVDEGAVRRYGYKKGDKIYRTIIEFMDMLCDKPFKQK